MVQLHNFFFLITSMVVPRGTAAPVLLKWFVSRDVPIGAPFSASLASAFLPVRGVRTTTLLQGIIDLHHDIFFFFILIFVFVSWILVRALWHFHYKKNPIPQRIVHKQRLKQVLDSKRVLKSTN